MKYKLSEEHKRKVEQFSRSNFAQLFVEIFIQREKQINDMFRSTLPEGFQQVQGRALEINELIEALKIKGLGE
jgi:hypothetical protein